MDKDKGGVERSNTGEVVIKSVPENICVSGVPSSGVTQGREAHQSGNFLATRDGKIVAQYYRDELPETHLSGNRLFRLEVDGEVFAPENTAPHAFCAFGGNICMVSESMAKVMTPDGATYGITDIPPELNHSDGHQGNLTDSKGEPLTPYKNLPEYPNLVVPGQGGKVFVNFSTAEPYHGDRGHVVELDSETGTVRNIEGASLHAYAICDLGEEIIISGRAGVNDVVRVYNKETLQLTREIKVRSNQIGELPVKFAVLGSDVLFLSGGGQIHQFDINFDDKTISKDSDIRDVSSNIDTTRTFRDMVGMGVVGQKLFAVSSRGSVFAVDNRDLPLRNIGGPQEVASIFSQKETLAWRVLDVQLQEEDGKVKIHCLVDNILADPESNLRTEVRTITRNI